MFTRLPDAGQASSGCLLGHGVVPTAVRSDNRVSLFRPPTSAPVRAALAAPLQDWVDHRPGGFHRILTSEECSIAGQGVAQGRGAWQRPSASLTNRRVRAERPGMYDKINKSVLPAPPAGSAEPRDGVRSDCGLAAHARPSRWVPPGGRVKPGGLPGRLSETRAASAIVRAWRAQYRLRATWLYFGHQEVEFISCSIITVLAGRECVGVAPFFVFAIDRTGLYLHSALTCVLPLKVSLSNKSSSMAWVTSVRL